MEILNLGKLNLFPFAVLFFLLTNIAGFLFFIILKYHFNKFNYQGDRRGNWLVGGYLFFFFVFSAIGIITIVVNFY